MLCCLSIIIQYLQEFIQSVSNRLRMCVSLMVLFSIVILGKVFMVISSLFRFLLMVGNLMVNGINSRFIFLFYFCYIFFLIMCGSYCIEVGGLFDQFFYFLLGFFVSFLLFGIFQFVVDFYFVDVGDVGIEDFILVVQFIYLVLEFVFVFLYVVEQFVGDVVLYLVEFVFVGREYQIYVVVCFVE